MRKLFFLITITFLVFHLSAQELFILNEPASNVPKGVLGVREFNESYKEVSIYRNMFALRLMYGLLPNLSIYATSAVTNHHGEDFPAGLASHTHNANGSSNFSTGNFQRGLQYPYAVSGIDLYAKFRFLTMDKQNQHLRMAVYAEWSNVNVTHDEAEPTLLDDTKGYEGGLIVTYLKKHIAVSLTAGVIIPGAYIGYSPDTFGQPKVPPQIQTEIFYGKAIEHNLSFGYLLYPRHYENYRQTNINLYVEFTGKTYEQARVIQYGFINVPIKTPLLQAGSYLEIHPGIQAIINSNLRIDASVGFPLINKSYAWFYPIYTLGIQRYFFFRSKKKTPEVT